MAAQKVPIGPKGEAQTRYFFLLQTTRGKGGREPLMPEGGHQLEQCGQAVEHLVRVKNG